jgi:hypothetical protein
MSTIHSSAGLVNPYAYYTQPMSGKMAVPVLASQSLYAQFQYVQGVPSAEGGLSLDRLKVIDSLLAQINAHRQAGTAPVKLQEGDVSKPDEAIARLSAQVHKMQKEATPFQAWGSAKALVLDLSA